MAYRIDLFDSSGARVAIIQEEIISSLSLDTAINTAPTLTLSIPLSEEKSAYISPAYRLKIWNTTTAAYEHSVFTLCDPDIEDSGGALKITATYQGILTRLSNEDIEAYDTGSAGDTFENVISALLAYQLNTPAITLGTIEPVQTVALAVENTTIYGALNAVRDAFGGWFEVDADYKLNWYNDNTNTPDREIRRSKNLKSLTYTPSYTQIVNRVYAYGKGESDARITLLDAGEAHEYIEDATSQATYGIMAKRYVNKSITHPTTLLKYAQRILAQYKTPPYQYSVDVVNLAEIHDYDYSLESLGLDTRVRVIDDLLSVDVNTSIVSMSIDLLSPADITIELSTVKTDLSDIFKDIISTQNINQSVATQISAGQVTVLGTFVVADWASAGVTTIDGGNITANTITTSQLNFTPVDSTNVIGSINASTEGITISGAKIAISGDTTFSTGYDPSTKIASGGAAADINNNTTTISGGKITTNTIAANALTTSTMTARTITLSGADSILQGNYTAGSAGWQIKGDGNAEFNNVTIRGTLAACTILSGHTMTVYGNVYFKDNSSSTEYFEVDDQFIGVYFNSSLVAYLGCDLNALSPIGVTLPSSATGTNTPGLYVDSYVSYRSAAHFQLLNSSASTPAVYIHTFSTTQPALQVVGLTSCQKISCSNISCYDVILTGGLHFNGNTSHDVIYSNGSQLIYRDSSGNSHTIQMV